MKKRAMGSLEMGALVNLSTSQFTVGLADCILLFTLIQFIFSFPMLVSMLFSQ